jgi:hypothetical protein
MVASYTLEHLVGHYRADSDSSYQRLSYGVRVKHDRLLARIMRENGKVQLRDIGARTVRQWHRDWSSDGKNAMASSLVARLRVLFRYGATELEDWDCKRLSQTLSLLRFPTSSDTCSPEITEEQATAVREKAREVGYFSIALAQALQFELRLSQKDIIGEWVPLTEPGEAMYVAEDRKWLRGLRWSDIGSDLTLRHRVGSDQRPFEFDLRDAPMVMAELEEVSSWQREKQDSPLVVCEYTAHPWSAAQFRTKWRLMADMAGVPSDVRNTDPLDNR